MSSLSLPHRLASAHAAFCGRYGDVTRLARGRGVYRQALYREAHAVARALGPAHAALLAGLRQRLGQALAECDRLRQRLAQAVVVGADRQAAFAATAQALGASLSAARALLVVLAGPAAPSVARLGRLAHQAARRAAAALAVLDGYACGRARQVAADEIFAGRRPVRMTVEQHSLCWPGGRLAPARGGPGWAEQFARLPAAQQVTRDGGHGLRKGLALANAQRRKAGLPEVADQEDHFHILFRGRRGLREVKARAARALKKAGRLQAALQRDRRKGKVRGAGARARAVAHGWQVAEAAFGRWSAHERAFERLRAGLRLFTPDGRLNSPGRAQAEVEAALAAPDGPEWSRRKARLVGPKAFTFLARARQQLEALPVPEALCQAAVRSEGLRRQPEALRGEGEAAGALRGVLLACGLVLALSGEAGAKALALVRGVLGGACRSSSLVEGLNSVLRMQQRRQKRLTQGLLDLKRLHWNLHAFVAGKRKGQSPYEQLGLRLPPGTWWQLLTMTPERLRDQLSELNTAA